MFMLSLLSTKRIQGFHKGSACLGIVKSGWSLIREPRAGSVGLQKGQQLIARLSPAKHTPKPGIVNVSLRLSGEAGRRTSGLTTRRPLREAGCRSLVGRINKKDQELSRKLLYGDN